MRSWITDRRGMWRVFSIAVGGHESVSSHASRTERRIAAAFVAAAMLYVAAGLSAMVAFSPRVPFADAWRHYARLLDAAFPAGVFALDNGHPEVFANLVRWASLSWLQGDERVQIAIGLVLALATLGVLQHVVWRTRGVILPARAAAAFALSLGVFWLGNARALAHDNETLHVYSVTLCAAIDVRQ
jgi:hypothetical protein